MTAATTVLEAAIRPAWPADLTRLGRVDPSLADPARGRAVGQLLGLGLSWIAEANGVPIAYAATSLGFFSRPLVDRLVVAEPYRRRGVGLALVERCASAHADDRLFVTIKVSDAPMRELLAKAGFRSSGIIFNLDPADPELVYVKLRGPPLTFVKYRPPA